MKQNPQLKKQAFTLVELMIASALALLVLGGLFSGLSQHQKTFNKKNIEQELQQNVRTAMLFLQRDLRYAGSGLTMGYLDLDDWFGLDSTINKIPWITSTGDGTDEIIIAGITGKPVATLSSWVDEGASELNLIIFNSSILPYDPVVGDVLIIAGIEAVIVTEVLASNKIRVSRDPHTLSTGVHLVYPAGTEIFQINVIKYWVTDVEGVPTLLRDDSRFTYESNADRVIADGIEGLSITRSGNLINVLLKGRSRLAVAGYTDDAAGDSHVRYELSSSNRLRNTAPYLSIQGWPSDILYATNDDDSDTATPTPTPSATAVPTAQPTGSATASPTVAPTSVPTVTPSPTPDNSPGNSGNAPGQVNRPKKK